jgi:hypothetical protein
MIYFYVYELAIWLALMIFVVFLFKRLTRKIKNTDEHRTKNSLFMIMIFVGLPLLLFEIIAPVVILMGDQNMPLGYKLAFGGEIIVVIIYFIQIQRTKKT